MAAGLSIREIASHVDRSPSTVRHWLRRYGLATTRATRLRAPAASEGGRLERDCRVHGRTVFVLDPHGHARCARCRSQRVADHRRRIKQRLVREAGGCCALCGYQRYLGALQFHHRNRTTKAFSISRNGITRSLARARIEAAKCVLLCANCHAEVEGGVTRLEDPSPSADKTS